MSFEVADVERKTLAILRVLADLDRPAGARTISGHLKDYGVVLTERGVRYHLRLLDERGLTQLVGRLDGRIITTKGQDEVTSALVRDKIGFAIARIELLAYRTEFDYTGNSGGVLPVNLSFFPAEQFQQALAVMRPVFERGYCVSQLVAFAEGGQQLGDTIVPAGKTGLATVCSVAINGTLLKAGVPINSKFGGVLEVVNQKPARFTELIHYDGSSLDPSEIFIKARMTSTRETASTGSGKILANFRDIPAACAPTVQRVIEGLARAGIGGVIAMGKTSEPVCQVPAELNRIGMVLTGGMNPVAAAQEAGIAADNRSMSTVMDYRSLVNYADVLQHFQVK